MNNSTIDLGNKGYIEPVNTSDISDDQLNVIFEIEQDIWAHGIGSYIVCNDCNQVSSKNEVFGDLEPQIQLNTVSEIERILEITQVQCPCCTSSETNHVFGQEYRDQDLGKRYDFDDTFLCVYKDISGTIRGFIDVYITDFDSIYKREFSDFYGDNKYSEVYKKSCDLLGTQHINTMICMNHLGAHQGYASLPILYYLVQSISIELSNHGYQDFPGIYDSILGNPTNGMYDIFGGHRLNISKGDSKISIHDTFSTDIMVHPRLPFSTLNSMEPNAKDFFKQNMSHIKKIVKV